MLFHAGMAGGENHRWGDTAGRRLFPPSDTEAPAIPGVEPRKAIKGLGG
jgi:hypothetical protein